MRTVEPVVEQLPAQASRSAWRRVLDDVRHFDRGGISGRNALRMAAGTTIALAIGYAAGSWASGAAAAGGALAVGIGSVVPAPRPRIAVLTWVAVAMALGTFIGSASSSYPFLHVVLTAAASLVCGLLVAVEPTYTSVGINALIAFLVYGRFAAPPLVALRMAALVGAGALLQLLLVVVARHRPAVGRALSGLARAYATLAGYARDLKENRSSLPVAQAIDAAGTDLDYSFSAALGGDAAEAWTSLAAEAGRIRLELLSLAGARASVGTASGEQDSADADLARVLDELAAAVARLLRRISEGLGQAAVPDGLDELMARVEEAVAWLTAKSESAERDGIARSSAGTAAFTVVRAATAARALAGQLRAVRNLLPDAVTMRHPKPVATAALRSGRVRSAAVRSATRVSRRGVRGVRTVTQRMRANLTWRSDALQHAVRLAAVVTLATVVAHVAHLGRGYWLALTAVIVLRPEFSATFTRGVARAVGTVIGVVAATAIAVLAQPHGWVLLMVVGCFVWLSGALFNASYLVFSIAVTGVVVFLLEGLDNKPVVTAEDRLLATLLGAALALTVYGLWPAWGRRQAADAMADLTDATRRYVSAVLSSYADDSVDAAKLSALSREVRLIRTNTESAVDRSLSDPQPRRIEVRATAGVLAALRRLSIAAHALRLQRSARQSPIRVDLLDALVGSLDVELRAAEARLRFGRVTFVHEPLRDRQRALAEALEALEVPGDQAAAVSRAAAVLAVETDELVDATNSLKAVLDGSGPAFPPS